MPFVFAVESPTAAAAAREERAPWRTPGERERRGQTRLTHRRTGEEGIVTTDASLQEVLSGVHAEAAPWTTIHLAHRGGARVRVGKRVRPTGSDDNEKKGVSTFLLRQAFPAMGGISRLGGLAVPSSAPKIEPKRRWKDGGNDEEGEAPH